MSQANIFVLDGQGSRKDSPCESISSLQSSVPFADFETIQPGDKVECDKTILLGDVEAFAKLSGDMNPLHLDESFALRTHFQRPVVHGMLLASYVSALVGMRCPGPGALWSQQNFRWQSPVFIGDRVHLTLRVTHKSTGSRSLTIEVKGINQDGKVVMEGEGVVSVLEERIRAKDISITERVAFVTGTSSGVGVAIASALAQAGASVVVNYRDSAAEAEELCAAIESKRGRAMSLQADLADCASVTAGIRQVAEKFNRPVDLLINNSDDLSEPRPFVQTTWDDVRRALDVHLRATFHCCQAVIPGMSAQKSGRIINIGSVFAKNVPPPNWSSFVITKCALQGLTRSLAAELGPQGIRVNTVSPGLIENDLVAGAPNRMQKVQAMQTPLRRLASADDIAAVVAALCSDAGNFITGTDIPVCGGSQM